MQNETTLSIPDTQNKAAGFWDAIDTHPPTAKVWQMAFTAIMEASDGTNINSEDVRRFLDSDYGRDFAEEVADQILHNDLPVEKAIQAAVEKWLDWTITRILERETGMPHGYSYLYGAIKRCCAPSRV